MNKWIEIDERKSLEGINQIHLDTRDFKCLASDDWLSISEGKYDHGFEIPDDKDKFTMPEGNVLNWLKNIRSMSRSRKENWSPLNFEGVTKNFWGLKYIRVFRLPDDPQTFIICDRYVEAIEWRKMVKENLK